VNSHDELHEIALAEWLAGEGPQAREAVRARAAECSECAEHLEELRAIKAALDDMKHERDEILALAELAPKSTRADVLAAAARVGVTLPQRETPSRETPLRATRPRILRFVAAATAVAAMVAFAFLLGRNDRSVRETPVSESTEP
jgi:hypothetical protein